MIFNPISHGAETRVRTWTDDSGSHRIEAEIAEILEKTVKLKAADGRVVDVPLERLSAEDLRLVEMERRNRDIASGVAAQTPATARSKAEPRERKAASRKTGNRNDGEDTAPALSPSRSDGAIPDSPGEIVTAVFCLLVPLAIVPLVVLLAIRQARKRRMRREAAFGALEAAKERTRRFVAEKFLVRACSRCHEFAMRLLEVSPNARSVRYRCLHCGKSSHAAAISPDSAEIVERLAELDQAIGILAAEFDAPMEEQPIDFLTAPAPLPFEQTQRSPIPEAVRHEVWRRDHGKCVTCGSNANLQYDHIIPVARGGATSVTNLQLLCQRCNQAKGAKI
ncbi:MAG: HNH endonuclease [Verrucomicrobia bacterium]|nr:HNH endonuclease [Verrucomicrobiota bacterium]